MKINITRTQPEVSRKDIDEFCTVYKIKLPKDYYNFLLEFNGGTPESNIFYYINEFGEKSTGCIQSFISLKGKKYNLEYEMDVLEERIPEDFLPIAYDPSGNFILLGLGGESIGKVFFWEHELENESDVTANVFPIKAKDFTDFINDKLELYELDDDDDPLNDFVKVCTTDIFEQKIKEDKTFINAVNIYGLTLSVLCTINNRADLLQVLIRNGVSLKGLLERAVDDDENYEIVKLMLKSGADVNEKGTDGYTPLMFAVKWDAVKIVELLLNSGASTEVVNNFGQTIPVVARIFSNDEMKQCLKKHKI